MQKFKKNLKLKFLQKKNIFPNLNFTKNNLIFFTIQDSPLSSKVAKFNQKVSEHKSNQLENPFSGNGHMSRSRSPKQFLSPDEYGK